ncbi:uncharacterized protein LOC127840558 [Dreissena polymorpha]|uniref:uncharacterized protein LOC127840558 n=1 Tax=Dreissena polymorpha TaxID=45954 RepID=UPI0022649CB4|nr:uncharacterized protein LOC127840558 [Dreissena polymorpha]
MVHIDFSENYACKYSDEIQSMHFGGSRNQLSLHTGVIYLRDEVIPICTVSDFLRHDPAGIWAHLTPILKYVTEDRNLTSIHFISDGPTAQYRNKNNIYLWGHKIAEYGFKKSTWNFLEAAHGKGAADGVGAAVKRAADQQVILKKNDITTSISFYLVLPADDEGEQLKQATEETSKEITVLEKIVCVEESLVGGYVVVNYDGMPYPGVVQAVAENDLEVQVMHRIGRNRFFWPRMEDVLWYSQDNIITLLQKEPEQVTSRHRQIPPHL